MDWQQLINDIPGAIYRFEKSPDGHMRFPFMSPIMAEWFGISQTAIKQDAHTILAFIHPEDLVLVLEEGDKAAKSAQSRHFEFRMKRSDGSWVWLEAYERGKMLDDGTQQRNGYLHNITERRQRADAIALMAHTDMLTGLPNRAHFNELLEHNLVRATRKNRALVILFVDLDKFKAVNDDHGHHIGDLLLMDVGQRLKGALRQGDIACRAGGDEFIVLLNDLDSPEQAESVAAEIAERIRAEMERPFTINNLSLHVSASIGLAVFPTHSIDSFILLKLADQAMYKAKTSGRNCVRMAGHSAGNELDRAL